MSAVSLHFAEQPLLRMGVSVSRCRCEIRVNDVPVYRDTEGRSARFDMPLNEWLFQGKNTISARLRAAPAEGMKPEEADKLPLDPRAVLALMVRHKRNRAPMRALTDLGGLRHLHGEDGKYLIDPGAHDNHGHDHSHPHDAGEDLEHGHRDAAPASAPARPDSPLPQTEPEDPGAWRFLNAGLAPDSRPNDLTVLAELHLPPTWPACPWRDAQPLPVGQAALYALRRLTGNAHDLMRRRDFSSLEKLLAPRFQRIAAAYHMWGADLPAVTGLRDRLRDPSAETLPLPEELEVITGGSNRVGKLVDPATGLPPLRLTGRDGVDTCLDLTWMLGPGGWMIAG